VEKCFSITEIPEAKREEANIKSLCENIMIEVCARELWRIGIVNKVKSLFFALEKKLISFK